MVKLHEVEDEAFTDKPAPSKNDALLVSDDEEDYTDTGKSLPTPVPRPRESHLDGIVLFNRDDGSIRCNSTCSRLTPFHPGLNHGLPQNHHLGIGHPDHHFIRTKSDRVPL